jgi:hypothetical protein
MTKGDRVCWGKDSCMSLDIMGRWWQGTIIDVVTGSPSHWARVRWDQARVRWDHGLMSYEPFYLLDHVPEEFDNAKAEI